LLRYSRALSRCSPVSESIHPLGDCADVIKRGYAGAAGARVFAKVGRIEERGEPDRETLGVGRMGDLGMGTADFSESAEPGSEQRGAAREGLERRAAEGFGRLRQHHRDGGLLLRLLRSAPALWVTTPSRRGILSQGLPPYPLTNFTLLFSCSEDVQRLVKVGGGRVEVVVAALHPSLAPVEVAACLGA